MSFILDALKKSESARQDTDSPGIADVPTVQRRAKTPAWVPLVAVLLGVNLLAVLYLLMRPESTSAPAAQVTQVPAQRPVAVQRPASTPATSRPLPAPPIQPATATVAGGAVAAEPAVREDRPTELSRDDTPNVSPPVEASPAVRQAAPEPEIAREETWLTFDDVRASGSLGLPDMHIDLHVYSNNPAERFVFINMSEYREQDTTAEGPKLQRITPEGALLEYRGSTFLLARD